MTHIRHNAELAVREMLREVAAKAKKLRKTTTLLASDSMDDGTSICLKISIDENTGSAVFDFSGTGPEVYGNCNAPRAVTYSAVIYCLRCLVGHDVPLNQGCLNPVTIKIPSGSILAPSSVAAVVGGNVLTSQRVVDVVLKAFGACAASQGCMNNLTFGDETVGYYETIAGGAGAGPTWHGRSGVHTHMTNTRITDPEIFERRYPVVLRQFSLRAGSGGLGKFKGGDGVARVIEFTKPLTVSILSERRALAPYGLFGGHNGATGVNILIRPVVADPSCLTVSESESEKNSLAQPSSITTTSTTSENSASNSILPPSSNQLLSALHVQSSLPAVKFINLGGKCTVHVHRKDQLAILTPGGGGYGSVGEKEENDENVSRSKVRGRNGKRTANDSLDQVSSKQHSKQRYQHSSKKLRLENDGGENEENEGSDESDEDADIDLEELEHYIHEDDLQYNSIVRRQNEISHLDTTSGSVADYQRMQESA